MKIYLAGPIDHCSDREANDWRTTVKRYLGADKCLDPMRRDYRGREHLWIEIVEQDLGDILDADMVLANLWKPGTGTPMEIFYASAVLHKPVAVVVPSLVPFVSPWLKYYATEVYDNLDDVFKDIETGVYG